MCHKCDEHLPVTLNEIRDILDEIEAGNYCNLEAGERPTQERTTLDGLLAMLASRCAIIAHNHFQSSQQGDPASIILGTWAGLMMHSEAQVEAELGQIHPLEMLLGEILGPPSQGNGENFH